VLPADVGRVVDGIVRIVGIWGGDVDVATDFAGVNGGLLHEDSVA